MRILADARGTSKTTKLIYLSNITRTTILTATSRSKKEIESRAKELKLNIPTVYSINDIKNNNISDMTTNIYVDDGDLVLSELLSLFCKCNVDTMSISISSKETDSSSCLQYKIGE